MRGEAGVGKPPLKKKKKNIERGALGNTYVIQLKLCFVFPGATYSVFVFIENLS